MRILTAIKPAIKRIPCRLGIHGPNWFGIGPNANGPRNGFVRPMLRRCSVCNAHWIGEETVTRGPYRNIEWTRINPDLI